ncbi:Non-canonical non-ribosomal peptide synthetase [Lachnellula subtilissima]|uniref:Non-canonical non-ribosomal peptide synthetase n=1 Tax=Lachnellula subtilissima TaxID=602034 RepID=A0A8H8S2F5_9HELO|nr:Non-canonical non-ribosomal peptide synthetase [Lachnellula subtilissima]
MGSIVIEEEYGRRLLPVVVESAARKNPDRVAYSFPITDDPSEGFHDITNSRYSNGVNRTAWWIEKMFGKPEANSFPTIGYIGPSDLRYPMLTIAAVKVGYKMMLLSPRNSVDGHLAVAEKCGCNLWVLPTQRIGHVDQVLEKRSMIVYPLPELLDLLKDEAVSTYPYNKSFAEARQDPFVVLHTSGSTGLPKPIVVPNGSLATPDAHHLLPPIEGRLSQAQYFVTPHRAYSTFPNFHSAGMVWCFAFPFFYELSIVLGPAMVPVNLDLVNSMFDYGNVDGSCLAPSTLEEISKIPASLQRIGKTLFTCFGGGPLSQECGNRINAVTRVFNTVGVTEGSLFPIVQAEREDWNYIHFHPFGGYTYRQTSDELFEQFQTRDPKLDLFQAFLQTFPDQDEFSIKDLYLKHPTKSGRWLYKGRADDIIVLSNGEKLNPLDMEASINDDPKVKASLIVGFPNFLSSP